ncbi:MAG: molybdopterin-dependent oxidoreductase [Saccharolobus sp.]
MKTICPYCGINCGIEVKEKKIVPANHITNKGQMCVKASTLIETMTVGRLLRPVIKTRETSWNEVTDFIAKIIRQVSKKYGKNAIAFYMGAQIPSEDQYLAVKLGKGVIGTGMFDSNVRLCMASAASALKIALGLPLPTADYDDIDKAETFYLIGVNPAANYPVLWNRIISRRNKALAKILLQDPVFQDSAADADIFINLKPGTDIIFLSGIIYQIIMNDHANLKDIENAEQLLEFVKRWPPSKVSTITGVDERLIRSIAERIMSTKTLFMWGMGVNQTSRGTYTGIMIIALAAVTNNLFGEGRGVMPLTGQHNSMGAREVGALAGMLPGYRYVENQEDVEFMEKFWNIPEYSISRKYWTINDMYQEMEKKKIKLLWIIGTNPVISLPESKRFREILSMIDTVIVQDIYKTETSEYADVILPAAGWGEREGIVTSGDLTISYLPKIFDPPGEARPDWEIIRDIGIKLGADFQYSEPKEILEELRSLFRGRPNDLGELKYLDLAKGRRYEFVPKRVKIIPFKVDLIDIMDNSPLLITVRISTQWNTMSRSGKSWKLNLRSDISENQVFISNEDANRLDLKDGDLIEITSRETMILASVKISNKVKPGILVMPYHYGYANILMDWKTDPISKEPAFKELKVLIKKVSF